MVPHDAVFEISRTHRDTRVLFPTEHAHASRRAAGSACRSRSFRGGAPAPHSGSDEVQNYSLAVPVSRSFTWKIFAGKIMSPDDVAGRPDANGQVGLPTPVQSLVMASPGCGIPAIRRRTRTARAAWQYKSDPRSPPSWFDRWVRARQGFRWPHVPGTHGHPPRSQATGGSGVPFRGPGRWARSNRAAPLVPVRWASTQEIPGAAEQQAGVRVDREFRSVPRL